MVISECFAPDFHNFCVFVASSDVIAEKALARWNFAVQSNVMGVARGRKAGNQRPRLRFECFFEVVY